MADHQITVAVEVDGDRTLIDYRSPLLANHTLDYAQVQEGEGGGQMRRLLCASAVGCYVSSVATALVSRGATVIQCRGEGSIHTTDDGRPIGRIDIRVEVAIEEDDVPILDHVRKILAGGCLVTHALAPAIDMTYAIVRVPAES